jgi:hypothetical protein
MCLVEIPNTFGEFDRFINDTDTQLVVLGVASFAALN